MRSFEVIVPDGWVKFDLTKPIDPQVTMMRSDIEAALPATAADAGTAAAATMAPALSSMRDLGVVAVLFPGVGQGSTTVAIGPLKPPDGLEPMDLLVTLAATDPTARILDLDTLVALRIHSDADCTDAAVRQIRKLGVDVGPDVSLPVLRRRMTRYLVGDPERGDRWVDISAEFVGAGEGDERPAWEFQDQEIDAIVGSFKWLS